MLRDTVSPGASEASEQIALMDWRNALLPQFPVLRWLVHTPNGEARERVPSRDRHGQPRFNPKTGKPIMWSPAGAKLKRMGADAGVPDLMLHVFALARDKGEYNGLAIELKVRENTLSDVQTEWLNHLAEESWYCAACWSARTAALTIGDYLQMPAWATATWR